MGVESKAGQLELRYRKSDAIPFTDSGVVKEAVSLVMDGLYKLRHHPGEIVYSYSLTYREEVQIRTLMKRKNYGYFLRMGEFSPIRLEEGIGTVISIKAKRK